MKIKILEKVIDHSLTLWCASIDTVSVFSQLPDLQPPEEEETESFK